MKFFDDIDFCTDVLNLKKTFITAVGHADDDERFLCRLADINLSNSYFTRNKIFRDIFWEKDNSLIETKQNYNGEY